MAPYSGGGGIVLKTLRPPHYYYTLNTFTTPFVHYKV